MSDKQNDNKFMAMLERKGIVRKADEMDESAQTPARSKSEADLRSMMGAGGRAANVTPAARQPVPGMINPVMPAEKPPEATAPAPQPQSQARPDERAVPLQRPQSLLEELDESEATQPEASMPVETMRVGFQQPTYAENPNTMPQYTTANGPHYTTVDPFKEEREEVVMPSSVLAEAPAYERPASAGHPMQSAGGDITERFLDIEDLYEALQMQTKRTDTIYLVEEYLKTLPESLPEESKREIVGKIVAASGFDYDLLMGDGVLRVKTLKEYAERFAQHTEAYVSARNAELDGLEKQMASIRKMIEARRELHKKQFFTIETEAQRLKEVLTFISG